MKFQVDLIAVKVCTGNSSLRGYGQFLLEVYSVFWAALGHHAARLHRTMLGSDAKFDEIENWIATGRYLDSNAIITEHDLRIFSLATAFYGWNRACRVCKHFPFEIQPSIKQKKKWDNYFKWLNSLDSREYAIVTGELEYEPY